MRSDADGERILHVRRDTLYVWPFSSPPRTLIPANRGLRTQPQVQLRLEEIRLYPFGMGLIEQRHLQGWSVDGHACQRLRKRARSHKVEENLELCLRINLERNDLQP